MQESHLSWPDVVVLLGFFAMCLTFLYIVIRVPNNKK